MYIDYKLCHTKYRSQLKKCKIVATNQRYGSKKNCSTIYILAFWYLLDSKAFPSITNKNTNK